jgi:putative PIN family toxin of toxin-antitoxin system
MIRAVLDANVLVSALISPGGAPGQLLDMWRAGHFLILVSEAILVELDDVLKRPRLRNKYRLADDVVSKLLRGLGRFAIAVTAGANVAAVRDPDDAKLLNCAAAGGADYIVSGDKDLPSLSEYEGIAIVTPSDFARILSAVP